MATGKTRSRKNESSDDEEDIVVPIDSLVLSSSKKRTKRESKSAHNDNVDDFVGALLGDDPKEALKKRKLKSKKRKQAKESARAAETGVVEAEEEEAVDQVQYNDDDVADLYAWDSDDNSDNNADAVVLPAREKGATRPSDSSTHTSGNTEGQKEEEEEEKVLRAERQRVLRLAMVAAQDNEANANGADDIPRNEDEWFDRLDEEAQEKDARNQRRSKKQQDADDIYSSSDEGDMSRNIVSDHVKAHHQHHQDQKQQQSHRAAAVSKEKREAVGKFLAIDCEMVGAGFKGSRAILARVSIVNYYGHVVMDTFVKPLEPVTDYRTWVSGIRKSDLENPGVPHFRDVQARVADLIKDRVLVGHAIKHDLKALMLSHPASLIRDTSRYNGFKSMMPPNNGATFALRKLAATLLNISIQEGEHSSVTDAKTTMLLYRKVKDDWERELAPKRYKAQIKKIRTKERFDQLRAERKEANEQQQLAQRQRLQLNPYQLSTSKE
ncbi:3'-5' exonuclease [Coemansia sp. RSA 1939]|nr:3'-5' exonuclease [Coemansia sp. RSA 1939]KAJ2612843.1 3'-5' exonuclease [Coemansia sp. RSA 1804]KAJ2694645.1 3'-5' exonuclease [Coemansia sp. RSA 1285]